MKSPNPKRDPNLRTLRLQELIQRLRDENKRLREQLDTAVELAKQNITGCGTCYTITKIGGKVA